MRETFYDLLRRQGIARRSFLEFRGLTTASPGLSAAAMPKIAQALETKPRTPVLWLHGLECAACCPEPFIRSAHPLTRDVARSCRSTRPAGRRHACAATREGALLQAFADLRHDFRLADVQGLTRPEPRRKPAMYKPSSLAFTVPALLLLVFSLFFAASLAAQDCADCAPDDDTMRSFLTEAEKGDPLAMTRTALLFFREGNAAGQSWLQKAADASEPGALKIVADMHVNGRIGYPRDRKRAFDLYYQALTATTSAQAEKYGNYPPRYLLALKSVLSSILGGVAASGEEGARGVQEAARLFADAELYAQLARLLSQHPELDFPLDSLPPETLRILAIELEGLAHDDGKREEDRNAALRFLIKLYEEDGTGVHLAARQRERWESALLYARFAEDAAATERLTKKLQTTTPEKSARTRTASGRYSDNGELLVLLDNGLFYYTYASSVPMFWEGTWTEAAKGQVCLTPHPGELVLFGRFDAEKALDSTLDSEWALDTKWSMTDTIGLKMDENSSDYLSKDYLAKASLSWQAGAIGKLPDDPASFISLARLLNHDSMLMRMGMDKDTSVLLTALPVGNRMRVYRHALNPRYNDYMLWANNPFSLHLADGEKKEVMKLFQRPFKERKAKRQGMSFCGVIDGEKQEIPPEMELYYRRTLESNRWLAGIWRDGKSWTRVPAEDLGLHVLDISENED
jgi:hypothetical protein